MRVPLPDNFYHHNVTFGLDFQKVCSLEEERMLGSYQLGVEGHKTWIANGVSIPKIIDMMSLLYSGKGRIAVQVAPSRL